MKEKRGCFRCECGTDSLREERCPMIQLDLNPEERQVLIESLTALIGDLGMEIADTDRQDYRNELKLRKETLQKVVKALG